jgi:hypothetical protein
VRTPLARPTLEKTWGLCLLLVALQRDIGVAHRAGIYYTVWHAGLPGPLFDEQQGPEFESSLPVQWYNGHAAHIASPADMGRTRGWLILTALLLRSRALVERYMA